MESIKISIIIVTYNSEKDIIPCLNSIVFSEIKTKYEIIVVDNNSKDNTVRLVETFIEQNQVQHIQIIESENRGFNAGNNVGIKQAQGQYILLLNPDTEVYSDTIDSLYKTAISTPNLGCLGCALVNTEGEDILSAGYFPSISSCFRKILKKNYISINRDKKLQTVDFPSGATFLFEKAVIKNIGLMDENYFLFFDEADFAFQIKKLGFENYILTTSTVIHKFGQSTSEVADFSIQKNIESYFYFLRKNYKSFYSMLIISFELLILLFQLVTAKIIKHRSYRYFKKNISVFWREFSNII